MSENMPKWIYVGPGLAIDPSKDTPFSSRYAYCPPGYRVVKEEPDKAMIEAGENANADDPKHEPAYVDDIFKLMLAASPKPGEEK